MCGGLDEAVRTSLERKISDGLLAARSSHPIVKTHRPKAARSKHDAISSSSGEPSGKTFPARYLGPMQVALLEVTDGR